MRFSVYLILHGFYFCCFSAVIASANTLVEFQTNAPTPNNRFIVELYDGNRSLEFRNTPITVANFLNYVNSGAYDNTIIHRSVSNFVIQGGGFIRPQVPADQPNSNPVSVTTNGTIINEPGNANIRGTIAMAKLGGQPDSATSQWFFNLSDNAFLDTDNGGYTVFGRILDNGMTVIDQLASALTYDATTYYSSTALSNLPLWDLNENNIILPDNFVTITSVRIIPDTDGDGLNDYVEVNTHNTNPNNKDTDTDGFEDNFELTNQTSPTSSASTPQMGLAIEINEYASSLSVDITVQSPVGGLLAIEQSENLQDWTSIELFEGNGRTISRVFPREDNASAFYRVRLLDQTP